MLGRILRDLTLSDLTFGGGPLLIAALAAVNAVRANNSYARWSWTAVIAIMLAVCAIYLLWAWRRRADLKED